MKSDLACFYLHLQRQAQISITVLKCSDLPDCCSPPTPTPMLCVSQCSRAIIPTISMFDVSLNVSCLQQNPMFRSVKLWKLKSSDSPWGNVLPRWPRHFQEGLVLVLVLVWGAPEKGSCRASLTNRIPDQCSWICGPEMKQGFLWWKPDPRAWVGPDPNLGPFLDQVAEVQLESRFQESWHLWSRSNFIICVFFNTCLYISIFSGTCRWWDSGWTDGTRLHDGPGCIQMSAAATHAVSHHAFPDVGMCACGAAGGGIFLSCWAV